MVNIHRLLLSTIVPCMLRCWNAHCSATTLGEKSWKWHKAAANRAMSESTENTMYCVAAIVSAASADTHSALIQSYNMFTSASDNRTTNQGISIAEIHKLFRCGRYSGCGNERTCVGKQLGDNLIIPRRKFYLHTHSHKHAHLVLTKMVGIFGSTWFMNVYCYIRIRIMPRTLFKAKQMCLRL